MKRIPLYDRSFGLPVSDYSSALDTDPRCERCELHRGTGHVCLPAEGQPGGLLVVGGAVSKADDRAGRPYSGTTGGYLRRLLRDAYGGPVALTYAVRCNPRRGRVATKHVNACRPYLSGVLGDADPERVVLLGGIAAEGFVGYPVHPTSARGGYIYTGDAVPVFYLPWPGPQVQGNRFYRAEFEEDLRWALETDPALPPWRGSSLVVEDELDAAEAVAVLETVGRFSFDCETYGRQHDEDFRLLCVACSPEGFDDAYVWPEAALRDPGISGYLKRLMANPRVVKDGHNVKYDQESVWLAMGVEVEGIFGDTRVWRRMVETEASGRLEDVAELVGMGGHKREAKYYVDRAKRRLRAQDKETSVLGGWYRGKNYDRYAYAAVPDDTLHRYVALDAVSTQRLTAHLWGELGEAGLQHVWEDQLRDASWALGWVERWGMPVDRDQARLATEYVNSRLAELDGRLRHYGDINFNSVPQLSDLLFNQLGLRTTVLTGTGKPSTGKEALAEMEGQHPIVANLREHKRLEALRTKFIVPIGEHTCDDGRVHPALLLDGTGTGRLSCREPNLQAIKKGDKGDEERMMRNIFAAPAGRKLVQFDYSQMELRIAAAISGDEAMKEVFLSGKDYHARTAAFIQDLVPFQVDRRMAKAVNFGLINGVGDARIAHDLKITEAQAASIRKAITSKFHGYASWVRRTVYESTKSGFAHTVWGPDLSRSRRRKIYNIGSPNSAQKHNGTIAAYNTAVQGTASDYCLASLVEVCRWIHDDAVPAKLILQIHDALVLECGEDAVDEVLYQVNRIMTSWPSMGVPLKVDAEVGPSWGEMEEVRL